MSSKKVLIEEPPSLPIVELLNLQTPLRSTLPPDHLEAVRLVKALHDSGYVFAARQTDTATLSVTLSDGLPILLPLASSRPPQSLVNALQLISSEATIDPNHQIDLRYQPPVIRDLRVVSTPAPEASASASPTP